MSQSFLMMIQIPGFVTHTKRRRKKRKKEKREKESLAKMTQVGETEVTPTLPPYFVSLGIPIKGWYITKDKQF